MIFCVKKECLLIKVYILWSQLFITDCLFLFNTRVPTKLCITQMNKTSLFGLERLKTKLLILSFKNNRKKEVGWCMKYSFFFFPSGKESPKVRLINAFNLTERIGPMFILLLKFDRQRMIITFFNFKVFLCYTIKACSIFFFMWKNTKGLTTISLQWISSFHKVIINLGCY